MFDHPNDPQHLIDSLIGFVELWRGIRPWYGLSQEKIDEVELPRPLAKLYAALGNMPGTKESPFPFARQDQLLPFELLQLKDNRLLFAVENQGCWRAYTQLSGDHPPGPELGISWKSRPPDPGHADQVILAARTR